MQTNDSRKIISLGFSVRAKKNKVGQPHTVQSGLTVGIVGGGAEQNRAQLLCTRHYQMQQ